MDEAEGETTVSRWRWSTWAAIVWTTILGFAFAALVGMAMTYDSDFYTEIAVFGSANVLVWWVVGLGIIAAARALSSRRRAAVMADTPTSDGVPASDVVTAPPDGVESGTLVRGAISAMAGLIATIAVSFGFRTFLAIDQPIIPALAAGSLVTGLILGARGWQGWVKAVLLLFTALFLFGLVLQLIQLLIEPA